MWVERRTTACAGLESSNLSPVFASKTFIKIKDPLRVYSTSLWRVTLMINVSIKQSGLIRLRPSRRMLHACLCITDELLFKKKIQLKVTLSLWPIQQRPPTYASVSDWWLLCSMCIRGQEKKRCFAGMSHLWNGKLAPAAVQHMEMYRRLCARSTAFIARGVERRWGCDSKQCRIYSSSKH